MVNPDVIAANLLGPDATRDARAGRETLRRTRALIASGQTFSRETTLSGSEILRTVRVAKNAGFTVNLFFVGVDSVDISRARVRRRVERGGHGIPEQVQARRFDRSLDNAALAAQVADRAVMETMLPNPRCQFHYGNRTVTSQTSRQRDNSQQVVKSIMTEQSLISLIDIAQIHSRRRQTIHKIVKRLGINTVKTASESARGQKVSSITMEDYKKLESCLTQPKRENNNQNEARGVFYLILLEPELDPGRFKVGFTANINERIRSHRTVAPLLKVVKTWPCRIAWEKTAIDCVTSHCEQVHTEVFRTDDIQEVIERADQFFKLMPRSDDLPPSTQI